MVSIFSMHEQIDLNDGGNPPHLNQRIGDKYGIYTMLGAGKSSRVYGARVFPTGEEVAVKVLRENCNTSEDFQRLKWETEVLSSVSSEYFPRLIDFGVSSNESYLVTEIVRGETLSKLLRDYGRLAYRDALDVAIQLGQALEHLHSHGIVHASFSTADIMLQRLGNRLALTLVDLDSTTDSRSGVPQRLPLFGEGTSFEYMSPEQAKGESVDFSTDVYIFALVFYELLAGKRPFCGSTPVDMLNARFVDKPESIFNIVGEVEYHESLDQIFASALDPERRNRIESMSDFCELLETIWQLTCGYPYVNPRIEYRNPTTPVENTKASTTWIQKLMSFFDFSGR